MRLKKKESEEVSANENKKAFTREFKRQSAEAIISGQVSPLDLSRKYGISPVIISRWKKEYLEGKGKR